MIIRHTRQDEFDYRASLALSQSKLKLLLAGVALYNSMDNVEEDDSYYKEKRHFIIGSAVDSIITMGESIFSKEYYVSQLTKKPSATIMSIVREAYDFQKAALHDKLTSEHYTSDRVKASLMMAADSHKYQPKWKEDTRYNKLINQGQEYWNELIGAEGKQILSDEEVTLINDITDSILEGKYTATYFEDRADIVYQLPIYFEYMGIECKALLDVVHIDHTLKVIQPIDVKTMGDYTINFPKHIYKRRYDIQAAYYTEALKYKYPGYTILPFKFIVQSTIKIEDALVFTLDEDLLNRGKYGLPEIWAKHTSHVPISYKVDGFIDGVELYTWYIQNGFEIDKRIVEHSGDLLTGLTGIKNENTTRKDLLE